MTAWVSRCISRPCWSTRASAWLLTRVSARPQASGSAATPPRGGGSCPAALVNQPAGTGSGARNAQIRTAWAAARSAASSWSRASWVTAASDSGYDAGRPASRISAARARTRRAYSVGGGAGLRHVPGGLREGQRQVPHRGSGQARARLVQPRDPAAQQLHRLAPVQHVNLD